MVRDARNCRSFSGLKHVVDLQIFGIELRSFSQSGPIEKGYARGLRTYQAGGPHFSEGAIDMDNRQSESVAELALRHGKIVSVVVGQPRAVETMPDFAKQVRQTGVGRTPAQICYPFPADGSLEHGFSPQTERETRILFDQIEKSPVWDNRKFAMTERAHAMIDAAEQPRTQVAQIAWDEESHDLPAAIA
jgi:hypothetical protein